MSCINGKRPSRRFGGSGKPKTSIDWVQNKKWVYPALIKSGRFTSLKEIEVYFSGDKIVCLECGVERKSLCSHLKIHKMTAKEYKEKYNIPKGRGLIGSATKKLKKSCMINAWGRSERLNSIRGEIKHRLEMIAPMGSRSAKDIGYRYSLKRTNGLCPQCGNKTHPHPSNPRITPKFCSSRCSMLHQWSDPNSNIRRHNNISCASVAQ